ncbi:MAG: ATP-binding cassette domain-containing protein [Desulfosarcinaceae bacterium]|nr:ATP-binding cassette domain-containing protein [Desulfosarcinaceae bacterium]
MDPIIEIHNLIKTFNGVSAVDGISFSVAKGAFFGLLGPNGAGKTTTIRMLYGFTPPSSGELRVFRREITSDWRWIKAKIGVCHQENTLDPDLTVRQNLLVYAGYFAVPKAVARRRAEELLDFFALSHRGDAKVMELSGGMARRVILARALINDPDLLILDEPTTGLDPQSRHQLWERLETLKASGLTVLLTTHYMEEAERLCDRLVIIDHGKILVEGSPQALKQRHAGDRIVEVAGPGAALLDFLAASQIPYDDLGERLLIYLTAEQEIEERIRSEFCMDRCTFRSGTLEDVFLRLTGRELRE